MRPASASAATPLVVLDFRFLLVFALSAALSLSSSSAADSDEPESEAETRFARASFERLIEELGFSSDSGADSGRIDRDASRLFCELMCERFRHDGLTPSVDCPRLCSGASPAAASGNPSEETGRSPAPSDSHVSRNASGAVGPATAPENPSR